MRSAGLDEAQAPRQINGYVSCELSRLSAAAIVSNRPVILNPAMSYSVFVDTSHHLISHSSKLLYPCDYQVLANKGLLSVRFS